MIENGKLPAGTWYMAMAFKTCGKKGISAVKLQHQLGHKRYDLVAHAQGQGRDSVTNLTEGISGRGFLIGSQ